ncbi:MAG: gamma-glutamyl kinase [Alphaproteobacteria bacterium]|nr:MAG: gamma-glutamyl kinase [Alphaproteobacteria bacterium]
MLVFWEERLVFLATPKTGTTAIEMALRPVAGIAITDPPVVKHTPIYRFRRFLAPYLAACGAEDFETVAAVRHPVDWLGSWYRYRSRPELEGHPNSTRGISFDAFVRGYLKKRRPPFADVGSQAKFLADAEGRVAVDHLFRYEAQPALLAFLEKRLGREIKLKRLNESPPAELSLRPRLRQRLEAELPAEFAVWKAARQE